MRYIAEMKTAKKKKKNSNSNSKKRMKYMSNGNECRSCVFNFIYSTNIHIVARLVFFFLSFCLGFENQWVCCWFCILWIYGWLMAHTHSPKLIIFLLFFFFFTIKTQKAVYLSTKSQIISMEWNFMLALVIVWRSCYETWNWINFDCLKNKNLSWKKSKKKIEFEINACKCYCWFYLKQNHQIEYCQNGVN